MTDHNRPHPFQNKPIPDLNQASASAFSGLAEPKKYPASMGTLWIKQSFRFFKQAPGTWIGITVLFWLLSMVLSSVSFGILDTILLPVLSTGLLLACQRQEEVGSPKVTDLLLGFRHAFFLQLLLIGLVSLVAWLSIILLAIMLVQTLPIVAILIISVILSVGLIMMMYYSCALVVLQKRSIFQAMRLSLRGCWYNLSSLSVWGFWVILLTILAILPLGLGLFVVCPMILIGHYISYKAIFTDG